MAAVYTIDATVPIRVVQKFFGTTNPGSSLDVTMGVQVGDEYINTSARTAWTCTLNTAGSASWTQQGGGGGGGGSPFSFATKTSNYTIVSADSLTTFDNAGAVGTVNFTLPTYAVGLEFSFVIMAAQTLRVTAPAGVSIAMGALNSATGGNVAGSTPFSAITIVAPSGGGAVNQWVVTSGSGGGWTVT